MVYQYRIQQFGNNNRVRIPKVYFEVKHSESSESTSRKVNLLKIITVGNIAMINPTEQKIDEYLMRQAFVENYCERQSLAINDLTVEQALEIRSLPDWQYPITSSIQTLIK